MFDVGPLEIFVLLIVGLLVFGPDRLPEIARQGGSWIRDLRRMVANARRDLSDGLGVDEAELRKLQDLNPKAYLRRNVLDGLDLDLDLGLDDERPRRRSGAAPSRKRAGGSEPVRNAASGSGTGSASGSASDAASTGASSTGSSSAAVAPAPPPFDPDAT